MSQKVYVFYAEDRIGVVSMVAVTNVEPTEDQQWELLEAYAKEHCLDLDNYAASEFTVEEKEVTILS